MLLMPLEKLILVNLMLFILSIRLTVLGKTPKPYVAVDAARLPPIPFFKTDKGDNSCLLAPGES